MNFCLFCALYARLGEFFYNRCREYIGRVQGNLWLYLALKIFILFYH